MRLEDYRRFYADEIRWAAGIQSPALVEAFARVPRESFLGPPPWLCFSPETAAAIAGSGISETSEPRDLYHNILVALDAPRHINNGQPSALARWIDALGLQPGERVFHLGSGVGYYTAILAEVVGPQGSVVAAEVDPALAARARTNLAPYSNVTLHEADGVTVDTSGCQALFINAGVTHPHSRWLDRLPDGGRIVLPLTSAMSQSPQFGRGAMFKIARTGEAFTAKMVSIAAIISCTSLRDPELSDAIDKALVGGKLQAVQRLRLDPHDPTDACVVHSPLMCLGKASPAA